VYPRIGVGFSYAEHGESIDTTEKAAKNVHAFVSIFFETFNLSGRPFHLSGESYGVRHACFYLVSARLSLECRAVTSRYSRVRSTIKTLSQRQRAARER
jgi:carboxypeptidase C (cathepsin A)